MFKKSQFPVFVPRAFALAVIVFASSAFAQRVGDEYPLNVIIRDFPAAKDGNQPGKWTGNNGGMFGFEMFDQVSSPRRCAERLIDNNGGRKSNSNDDCNGDARCRTGICFSSGIYHSCDKGGEQLFYDANDCNDNSKRGYKNGPDKSLDGQGCWNGNRGQPVFVTRGMVQKRLNYEMCGSSNENQWLEGDTEALKGRACARPMPADGANTLCYGEFLHEWFTDGGVVKRINDDIPLIVTGPGRYKANYDYNTRTDWGAGHTTRGYFPLDKYEKNPGMTYGRENYDKWCTTNDVVRPCTDADGTDAIKHNYGFTMAGFAEFKYDENMNDMFKFIGDDDMWIFVDGELFEDDETGAHADLGGNHLAAPAVIDIKRYAVRKGWANGSMHVINFFYVERQTDGSNLMLELAISNLTPSIFGSPFIKKAETEIKDDGTETVLYVSNQVTPNDFRDFLNNPSYGFPILVYNLNDNRVYGYKLESITFGSRTSDGYTYIVTGKVCKDVSCNEIIPLSSGDSLSFNVVKKDDNWPANADPAFALSDESKYIKNSVGREVTVIGDPNNNNKWGPNATLRTIEIAINTPDTKPIKPPFAAGNPENYEGEGGKPAREDPSVPGGSGGRVGGYEPQGKGQVDNITQVWDPKANGGNGGMVSVPPENRDVHGFGVIGAQIPPQRAGELILTAFPNSAAAPYGFSSYEDWYTAFKEGRIDGDADLFGLPPQAKGDDWWGLADPTVQSLGGGYQFVKNGFPYESNTKGNIRVSPTRCTADIKWEEEPGKRASINCLNFNMIAQQPFQLAVTVYDQLGNFVTQYRETVTEQEFRNVTQAPNYLAENKNTLVGAEPNVDGDCKKDPTGSDYGKKTTTTTNGFINVNVNIYPFSTTGRRFGNGVYIAKVDRVDLPFTGCQLNDGVANPASPPFKRIHSEQKFGWMRATSNK